MPANTDGLKAVTPRCHICLGSIKPTLAYVRCGCGNAYHVPCSRRVGECPNCGRDIREAEKMGPKGQADSLLATEPRAAKRRISVRIIEAGSADMADPALEPDLKLKGLFSRSLRYGDWNDALLVLQNTGETAALQLDVKLSGDVELEALHPIARLAPGEKKEFMVRLRPRRMGELTVEVQVSFKRAYDNKTLDTKHQVKLTVK